MRRLIKAFQLNISLTKPKANGKPAMRVCLAIALSLTTISCYLIIFEVYQGKSSVTISSSIRPQLEKLYGKNTGPVCNFIDSKSLPHFLRQFSYFRTALG